jgi:hypothetical protein
VHVTRVFAIAEELETEIVVAVPSCVRGLSAGTSRDFSKSPNGNRVAMRKPT